MYNKVLLVISNYILMTYTDSCVAFLSGSIAPTYAAGTSKLSTKQPQNCTYLLSTIALSGHVNIHPLNRQKSSIRLPFSLIPTLH